MKHGIYKRFIEQIYSKEIYGWDEFFTEEEADDDYPETIEVDMPQWGGADASPIKIEEMQEMIQTLKDKGCTHVEIDYHCDHLEYEVYGYQMRKATEKEVQDETNKRKESIKEENSKKIKQLQWKIKKLEDEIQ